MGTITERNLYTCDGCEKKLPFDEFYPGGRIDSVRDEWFCRACNRPDRAGQPIEIVEGPPAGEAG